MESYSLIIQAAITGLCVIFASAGFWTFMEKRKNKNSAETKLLIGIAHDLIIDKSLKYIDRTWITEDEYETLYKYLYKPYIDSGGNGVAKKLVEGEVSKLPIRPNNYMRSKMDELQ